MRKFKHFYKKPSSKLFIEILKKYTMVRGRMESMEFHFKLFNESAWSQTILPG